jgi:hypothetical protein
MGGSSSKEIRRPKHVEGVPDCGKVVYQRQISRSSKIKSEKFRFTHRRTTIAGIACTPVEGKQIQSPEATVTGGGLNHKHVHMHLKPPDNGEWAYELAISVRPTPSQQVSIQ